VLEEAALARALGVKAVWLLNDLVATAIGAPPLSGGPGYAQRRASGRGTIAVIAPGTGLGEAF
jgi:glucokinase